MGSSVDQVSRGRPATQYPILIHCALPKVLMGYLVHVQTTILNYGKPKEGYLSLETVMILQQLVLE